MTKDKNKPKTPKKSIVKKTTRKKQAESSRELKDGKMTFPIVGIGASAGGFEAFENFLKAMPVDSGMAFVLIAHLDPSHVSILPELLQKSTEMEVKPVEDGTKVEPNHVYVIPPNKNLSILQGNLQLMDLPSPRTSNLPIDNFFRDLARDQGANAVCIIMSGTGTDGTIGLKAIKGEIGMAMVQTEESAKYDGMPRSAIATGLADYILAPDEMPNRLIKYTSHLHGVNAPRILPVADKTPDSLQKIFIIIRSRTDHDFSQYKMNTICRRIERRMNVHQIDKIEDYVRYLQDSDQEVVTLFKDLLIGVTNFFRDPDAFRAIAEKAIPMIIEGKPEEYCIRVWVPGCSSGEEAYSIAILLHEYMDKTKSHLNVQIFATDIDEEAISIARQGKYSENIMADIPPDNLKRYFVKEEDGSYRVKKIIREMLVFAPQNIIKDPPFTKLDMLCCRNLLIYLGADLQKKLFPIFHYSLKPGGILFLGTSETIGHSTSLFTPIDKKWKIFSRKAFSVSDRPLVEFPVTPLTNRASDDTSVDQIKRVEELSALQLMETILKQSDASPCAIIDDLYNVVYIHGHTGRFLEPAEGKVSHNILEMARHGLKAELASVIRRASVNKQIVERTDIPVSVDGAQVFVKISAKPIHDEIPNSGLLMIIFEEIKSPAQKLAKGDFKKGNSKKQTKTTISEIEQELHYTRENLQITIEELETSNEELKSTNEELQSTNEELQSTNEEMETSKEELQSLNEESVTVNSELQGRINELSKSHDDMKNLLDCTGIATLFLDTDTCIRRFTPKIIDIIPLVSSDIGRPIKHFTSEFKDLDLSEMSNKVLDDLCTRETQMTTVKGEVFNMRVQPYRTTANVIDGVVITFDNVSSQIQIEKALIESEKRLNRALKYAGIIIAQTDLELRYKWIYNQQYAYEKDSIIGKTDIEIDDNESTRQLMELKQKVLDTRQKHHEVITFPVKGATLIYDITAEPLLDDKNQIIGVSTFAMEISQSKADKLIN